MSNADSKLDAQLRDVPMPDGLLDRLMALPLGGDEDFDEVVCDVEVPAGLLKRLYAIPFADDAGLDEALRNVPVPGNLVASCRPIARRRPTRLKERPGDGAFRISRIAMAASLFLAVTLSLGSAMLLSWVLSGSGDQSSGPLVTENNPAPPIPAEKPLEISLEMVAGDDSKVAVRPSRPGENKREIELADLEPLGTHSAGNALASATLPRDADPLALYGLLGSPGWGWDDIPELPTRVPYLAPHGLDWPVVAGSNWPFLRSGGFHPFVSPGAHPRLQTCQVPLAVEPASYELARRYLERKEWPPIDRVRTEDFLAAVDYNFPRPKNQDLGLTVAGGPSPISGEGFCLLQVGVQARQIESSQHPAVHLVLLVDTSTSMRWGSRIEIVRRALRDLPGIAGHEDRFTLVTFNQGAHVLLEDMSRDALLPFAAAVDSLTAQGSTNVALGLREAYGVARATHGPGKPAVRVILLTDGLLDLEQAMVEKIEQQVLQAAGQDIPLNVIDLGQERDSHPLVLALSQAGRGTVRRAGSADEVRWALREIVTGRSQIVARAARLQVTFNPKSVLEYRLIGHEAKDWNGMIPGTVEADLHEGQAATALFEVRLAPKGPNDLASVDLTWYSPEGGSTQAGKTAHKARATVDRQRFATSLTSSAPSLQEAAVVAYAAEVLRHSPFIFRGHPAPNMPTALFRAVELSGQVDGRLRQLPSFDELVDLIRREMKAHPATHPAKD